MSGALFARKTYSLRRRLLAMVLLATLLIWCLAAILSYRQARHDVQEMMDAHMAQTASLLLAQASRTPAILAELPGLLKTMKSAGKHHMGLVMEFQIIHPDGSVLTRSAQAPATSLTGEPGLYDLEIDGQAWRTLVVTTETGDLRIQVFQTLHQRNKEALEIASNTVLPLGLLIPFLIGLIYFSVRRGLKPLDDLAMGVSQRSPENLQAFDTASIPREVSPLISALNSLLGRLGQALENERRFTADAAHELRTPLAAIRVQAQVALSSTDTEQHRHALNQVLAGTGRATRLVEQLLRLARLDPLARLPQSQNLDMFATATAVVNEMIPGVPERMNDLKLESCDAPITVSGDAELLAIAMRNLIDNALRYTPHGCEIRVFVRQEHGEALFGVRDAGPGVKPEELPMLVERFYRSNNTQSEGSGLGLAIVRRIAELHGARLEVESIEGQWFEARLRWNCWNATIRQSTA
jgi:two-component system sensor histidine kinase QseC